MPDFSDYEAEHPGVSPEWWRERKDRFPLRAYKHFEAFHDALWIYRNRQSEEHLHAVKLAVKALVSAIEERNDFTLKIARKSIVQLQTGGGHRRRNLVRGLHSFIGIVNPHVIPDLYRDY